MLIVEGIIAFGGVVNHYKTWLFARAKITYWHIQALREKVNYATLGDLYLIFKLNLWVNLYYKILFIFKDKFGDDIFTEGKWKQPNFNSSSFFLNYVFCQIFPAFILCQANLRGVERFHATTPCK